MILIDIAISSITGANYCCIISGISKKVAINVMQKIDLTKKKRDIIKHKNLLPNIKMGKEILIFGDIEIEKKNINSRKSYFLKDVDIEKVLVSNKILS